MLWVRNLLVSLFSSVLLLALIGGALCVNLNTAFSRPTKIEQWLGESQLYEHFVATGVSQAAQFNGEGAGQSTTVSSADAAVQKAAATAFPKQLITQSINTFLDSNYAWLQGKTATPTFKIDLTGPKTDFSTQIGRTVTTHLAQIPVCTPSQLSQLQSVDLLHIACRPAGIDPGVEAAAIEQQISDNGGFLSQPVITADNLTPRKPGVQHEKPYYQKLSQLPTAYRLAQKLPYVLAGVGLISALMLFLVAPSKRLAWRLLARLLIIAGVALSVCKLAFDILFNKFQDRIFNTGNTGQLQQSLTDFAHRAISYLTHLNLLAGLVYLGAALVIIIGLAITRFVGKRTAKMKSIPVVEALTAPVVNTNQAPKKKRPVMDVVAPSGKVKSKKPASSPPETEQAITESGKPGAPELPGTKPSGLGRRGSIQ